MKNLMVEFLKNEYGISEIFDKRENGKYIIEIIHEKGSEYYSTKEERDCPNLFNEFNKPEDQHNLFSEDEIIQHITVEKTSNKINGEVIKDVMHNIVHIATNGDSC